MKKFLIFICLPLFIVACESQKKLAQKMNSWIGSDKSEIIRSWGPPNDGVFPDGKGGEILKYSTSRDIIAPVGNMYVSRTMKKFQQIYCDSTGKIYFVRWGKE
jgi:hypothetical protein